MGTLVGCVVASHSPFWDGRTLAPFSADQQARGTGAAFLGALADLRRAVAAARPTVAVVVGPDHFRNFFYDGLPAVCVGIDELRPFGDFRSGRDDLVGHPAVGRALVAGLQERGFDPAVSYAMGLDHGIVQPYSALFPDAGVPLVPVMLACTGIATMHPGRALALGEAVGSIVAALPAGERVLVVGSGGLAHWTPRLDPDDPEIDPGMRAFVVDGRSRVREVAASREEAIARLVAPGGEAPPARLNPAWDERFLARVVRADRRADLAELHPDAIEAEAGNGGQEVRTWLVAAAAWGGDLEVRAYEPVAPWLTGMGCAAAFAGAA